MTTFLRDTLTKVKSSFGQDILNRNLLVTTILFALFDWSIWHFFLTSPELFIYTGFGLYPVEFLAIILIINTFMSFFAYDKEKEISYLLMSSNIFISFLILALEIFYLIHS